MPGLEAPQGRHNTGCQVGLSTEHSQPRNVKTLAIQAPEGRRSAVKRVAAAVGEGAQVVTALHAYLATLDAQPNLTS